MGVLFGTNQYALLEAKSLQDVNFDHVSPENLIKMAHQTEEIQEKCRNRGHVGRSEKGSTS